MTASERRRKRQPEEFYLGGPEGTEVLRNRRKRAQMPKKVKETLQEMAKENVWVDPIPAHVCPPEHTHGQHCSQCMIWAENYAKYHPVLAEPEILTKTEYKTPLNFYVVCIVAIAGWACSFWAVSNPRTEYKPGPTVYLPDPNDQTKINDLRTRLVWYMRLKGDNKRADQVEKEKP